jgi:hypothetical protein
MYVAPKKSLENSDLTFELFTQSEFRGMFQKTNFVFMYQQECRDLFALISTRGFSVYSFPERIKILGHVIARSEIKILVMRNLLRRGVGRSTTTEEIFLRRRRRIGMSNMKMT